MLAENAVVFQPAWTTMSLHLPNHKTAISQQVAGPLVCGLDCGIGEEA